MRYKDDMASSPLELESIRIRATFLAERLKDHQKGLKGLFISDTFLADSQRLLEDINRLVCFAEEVVGQNQSLENTTKELQHDKQWLELRLEKCEQIIIELGQKLHGIKQILLDKAPN